MVRRVPIADHRCSVMIWRSPRSAEVAEESPFRRTDFQLERASIATRSPRAQQSPSRGQQSIECSSSGHARRVKCRYSEERGPKAGPECSNRTRSGDYCTQHENPTPPFETLAPSQAALSICGSKPLRVSNQCQAPTLKGVRCSFKALPQAPHCKRHLNYSGPEGEISLHGSEDVPTPCSPSPPQQQGNEIDLQRPHKRQPSFAEEEALVPICRHCKIVAVRNCNLCESHGCRMRALSVVHEATEVLGDTQVTAASTSSSSRPSSSHRAHDMTRTLTLTDILPKLKVCRPQDFGMPPTIPVGINFFVWDRWWHVKQSLLGPQAGMGLFTVDSIPKGEDLFPYIGPGYDRATYQQIEQILPDIRCYALMYRDRMDRPSREVYIDGGTRHSNLAGYINSVYKDPSRRRPNVNWEVRENGCSGRIPANMLTFIMTVSIRPIASGEELYTTYDWRGAAEFVQQVRASTGRHQTDVLVDEGGGCGRPYEQDCYNLRSRGQKRPYCSSS